METGMTKQSKCLYNLIDTKNSDLADQKQSQETKVEKDGPVDSGTYL
jgi:hypothetical protein